MTPEHRPLLRGRVLVTLRPGEADDDIAVQHDVRTGAMPATTRTRHAAVDRVLRAFSPAMAVSRVFPSARNALRAGRQHLEYDDLEHTLGLASALRVDVDPAADPRALADALSSLSTVERAAPWYLCETPFDETRGADDDVDDLVGAREALEMEPGDSTLIVAVIDSGVAMQHPELTRRLRPGFDAVDLSPDQVTERVEFVGDARFRDRVPEDEQGHGTCCASILCARGLAMPRGLAGAAELLPLRALAAARARGAKELTAVGSIADIDVCMKLAVDLGARVLNLSFGTPETALRRDDPVPHAALTQYALERGCVMVAAAGNDGSETAYFPAALPGVIAVAAVDRQRRPARFSTRGPHVALSAPGVGVRGATLRGGYRRHNGTSFAAPQVAGACALLLARAARHSSAASPALVRDLLARSAAPFAESARAEGFGAGVLDVPAALRLADVTFREDPEAPSERDGERPEIPARPAAL